ncbi:cell division protein FtsA [Azorhizobium oxalatiphilum]|uniref:Cell division protein FtsA n=1 Tax=Azorhizobium oxalatiphilum TaxID=980631 RepID=A0A917C812_9HYPH|nr:cell division protein FtsA [Azorhizobium oxalatiphilum]GGF74943.1 cell division protein FtsA [Azorhizobium oxalatiphilum]
MSRSRLAQGFAPKMRPLLPKKSGIIGVLDIGTSKIVCMIGRLKPRPASDVLRRRTHSVDVLGIGHTRAHGVKGGAVVDMARAEAAIRQAVDMAERAAGVQIASVILGVSGARLSSQHYEAQIRLTAPAVEEFDIRRVLEAASTYAVGDGRAVMHALPVGYSLDNRRGIGEPCGMLGRELGVDMHVVTGDMTTLKNLVLCVERCHLGIEAMVAAPYAAALSSLTDDEMELGVTLIDMGAGTTTFSVVAGGHCVFVDGIAVGGQHITNDVARGLPARLSDAERLKALHGAVVAVSSDDHDMLSIPPLSGDERDQPNMVPKSRLVTIVKPRAEEIVELIRDRLKASGHVGDAGRRLVLTGGAAQLQGLQDLLVRAIGPQVRIGRPLGVSRLPEAARGSAFAVAAGLLVYPQVAGLEHFEPRRRQAVGAEGGTYFGRVGQWLRDSF